MRSWRQVQTTDSRKKVTFKFESFLRVFFVRTSQLCACFSVGSSAYPRNELKEPVEPALPDLPVFLKAPEDALGRVVLWGFTVTNKKRIKKEKSLKK